MKPQFDWLRIVHQLATLGRSIRGDVDVETDHQRERARGRRARISLDGIRDQIREEERP